MFIQNSEKFYSLVVMSLLFMLQVLGSSSIMKLLFDIWVWVVRVWV